MKPSTAQAVYLKDYQAPAYTIDQVKLDFILQPDATQVWSRLAIRATQADSQEVIPLKLDGEHLTLLEVRLNGRVLQDKVDYNQTADALIIALVPRQFELAIKTQINPRANTALEGLYLSGDMYCTQCEAHGFRRITYYIDRPDVMARFETRIIADKAFAPVLLSNGNQIDQGESDDGTHWALWLDPHPKPSYLFALVAGDLVCLTDTFTTRSGRAVDCRLYVERNGDNTSTLRSCEYALASLHKAMAWDEAVYGLEYDLDVYHIVAVHDFNMGAMENKSLNIFNAKYILADPRTATDKDRQNVERVVGHEYFHNWTGNRVTLRNWFQLSLKEGLTVFREQSFVEDMIASAVGRIEDVKIMRTVQFAQDSGPMAHPVRPESYIEINNFYTVTVYNKGAEVIRMLQTIVGESGFRRGMDLYFARHDGQAVTADHFIRVMEDANHIDLTQFRLWYSQAGTPVVHLSCQYDSKAQTLLVHAQQETPATPGQNEKKPLHIPLAVALFSEQGARLTGQLQGSEFADNADQDSHILHLKKDKETFTLTHVKQKPVLSALRNFSAPVTLVYEISDAQLCCLMAHETDALSRWDASQTLAQRIITRVMAHSLDAVAQMSTVLIDALRTTISRPARDKALLGELLSLPGEEYISQALAPPIDVDAIHQARAALKRTIAQALASDFLALYHACAHTYGLSDAEQAGQRVLKGVCLDYISTLETDEGMALCNTQYHKADNMTDKLSALQCLIDCADSEYRQTLLQAFYERHKDDPLLVNKWFTCQASADHAQVLDDVEALSRHAAFSLTNPNNVYALLVTFSHNPVHFHQHEGRGYALLTDHILLLDDVNPQVAARVANALTQFRRYDAGRAQLMREQLQRCLKKPKLSKDLYEIAARSLEQCE